MSRSIFARRLCLIALITFTASAFADETAEEKKENKKEKKPAAEAPAIETKTIEKGPFRIVVELDGVFEGEDAEEIILTPEEWSKLTVVKAAAHGARVRKGDVVLELETDKLDRAIADLQADLRLSEVALRQQESQLRALEKITPLELKSSRRGARQSEEDRELFFKSLKPLLLELAEVRLKVARASLEYKQEELRQLEKMYKADDITEETEEIVLKRARDELEVAKFSLEIARFNNEYTLKFGVPRQEEQTVESTERAILGLEKEETIVPLLLDERRLELDRTREGLRKSEEKLEKLAADRKQMIVRAPIDGIVYYGQLNRGKPADSSSMENMLCPHGSVPSNQVLMTVVSPRPMRVRVSVPEKYLHDLRPGLEGTAVPTGYPDLRLPVEIDRVGDIPVSSEKFDAWLNVRLKGKTKLLLPGMTCEIKFVPYLKEDAILVPPKAIVADELDDEKRYVEVLDKQDKPQRRRVTLGRETDEKVEIVKGLNEGDRLVLEPKKDQE
ncbi:MAG: HlyD family efflux transporter periplasmic adaptor subunit [Pirellulales bacterium]|nr:HlyD family efflux transporter periplasmic adaptor subunit [Pirellulales bacterium]